MFAVYVKKRTIYVISRFQKRIRVTIILTNKMMAARIFCIFQSNIQVAKENA